MKKLTGTLVAFVGFALLGCASGGQAVIAEGSPSNELVASSSQSSSGSHRDYVATVGREGRESMAFARLDRGIPTPQPARDPSMVGGPVPQPPIPATPEGHGAYIGGGNTARW